jgi:hypothetical protein
VRFAHAQDHLSNEMPARITLARVLLASGDPGSHREVEATLDRALEIVRQVESKGSEPTVYVELAELARQRGDEEGRQQALREAHRLFTEIGATGHAERLAAELALAAG